MLNKRQIRSRERQLKALGFNTYQEFLYSTLWYEFKKQIKTLPKNNSCKKCKSKNNLNFHHNTYRALLNPIFITCLCQKCHERKHGVNWEKNST